MSSMRSANENRDLSYRVIGYAFGAFAVYALLMALYVWVTSPNEVPLADQRTVADPATFYTSAQLAESERLNAGRYWLFFISAPWEWLIYFMMLAGGWANAWRERLERYKLPIYIRFPLFVLVMNAVAFLLYLPVRIAGYGLSRSSGISTQSAVDWLRDKLVAFGIGYVVLVAVSATVLWILSRGGRWWFKLWLLSVPFTLFMMYIQPVVIDPLYNRYEQLADHALEERIVTLAQGAGIDADRVYVSNMSAKTTSLNAYVNGLGSSLRIVIWDTTLEAMDEREVLLIMAHEIGHYVMHHLEWSAVGAIGSSLAVLWLGGFVYERLVRARGHRWGIRKKSDWTALPLLILLLSIASFISLPVSNAVSRSAESAADQYAYKLIGNAEGAVTMYQKLAAFSLSDVNPPLLVHWFWNTHPSDLARIRAAVQFAGSEKSE